MAASCGIVQLDYDGTVIFASSPAGPDQPALRRAQALAAGDEIGLTVTREILRVKLKGQAEVAGLLGSEETAGLIVRLAGEIAGVGDNAQILAIEATAAVAYWALWRDLPVQFARHSEVPEHSRTFGLRSSPLTGKPLRAATPGNALLNYLYRALESEMVIALRGVGLDPGIAIFHLDRDRRSSLALDAIEAVRPYVDCWLAAWLAGSCFAKRDFVELPDGEIRITRPLTSHLAMSGPIWRQAAAAVSGWLVQSFGRVAAAGGVLTGGITPVPQGLPAAPSRSGRLLPLLSAPLLPSSRPATRIARPPSRMTRSPELATNAVGRFQFVPANSALRNAPLRITAIPNFERSSPPSPPAAPIPNDNGRQISPSARRQAAARRGRDRRCSSAPWLR
jgi:hypothetical protein